MGRIASIDYGSKRIGLAISDERQIIATSLETILAQKSTKETAQFLKKILHIYKLDKIIVGLPLQMNGKEGSIADEVRLFASHLAEEFDCEIRLWDERLTSVQAERAMRESGMNRKKRSKKVDMLSAVIILQSYLEFLSHTAKVTSSV